MKRCTYCGRENSDDAFACSNCGTDEFKGGTPIARTTSTKPAEFDPNLLKKKKLRGILGAVGLAFCVTVGLFIFARQKNETQPLGALHDTTRDVFFGNPAFFIIWAVASVVAVTIYLRGFTNWVKVGVNSEPPKALLYLLVPGLTDYIPIRDEHDSHHSETPGVWNLNSHGQSSDEFKVKVIWPDGIESMPATLRRNPPPFRILFTKDQPPKIEYENDQDAV